MKKIIYGELVNLVEDTQKKCGVMTRMATVAFIIGYCGAVDSYLLAMVRQILH